MKKMTLFPVVAALSASAATVTGAAILERKDGGNPDNKTAAQVALELKASFDKALDAIKEDAAKAVRDSASSSGLSAEAKRAADEALEKLHELTGNLSEMEQKMARGFGGGNQAHLTPGQAFVAAENVKSFLAGEARGRISVEMKAIHTTLTTNADGSAGAAIAPDRLAGINEPGRRRMTIRALLAPGQTGSNSVEFVKETGFTNNAGPKAQGVAPGVSAIKLTAMSAPVRTIGHTMQASRRLLEDASQLASYLDNRARYGLAFKEELQLLTGDGTGENLTGLIPSATDYAGPIVVAGETPIDRLRLAALQVALAEYPATGFVLHPADWAAMEMLKDEMGRYILGNPQDGAEPRLWRLPVVDTPAQPVGTFLAGGFIYAAQIFDRRASTVEISTEDGDNFSKGLVTIRNDERLALVTYRPEAFITGDLVDAE